MNTVQPSNIENRIQVTVYLHPLLYVDSEVFDSALTDVKQNIFINPPLPGLGEELENPIKDEWERFIRDCVFVTKEAGFSIINNEYDSESNKSEAVITYGIGNNPSGTIICNLQISEHPFDATFPEEYKAKVQEYLKESSILNGTARKAGIDFQIEKVIVNDIETESWLNGFTKLYSLMRMKITDNNMVPPLEPFSKAMLRVLHRLDEINCNPDNSLNPIPTGFKSLDKVITGLNRSDLILLAARPGMGKTSFALDIAKHTAVNQKKTVAFFSLEMSRDQIATKLLSSEAMVERTKIFTGEFSDEEWIRIIRAGDVLSKYDIYLDDTPGITVGEIRSKLRRLKNIDFVVVDYLQLMSSGDKNNNHVQEISEIIKSLKKLAKEFNIPVLCVSQLSRSPEQRDDHRPMISDLGESVSIAQDSDVVLLLYREGYYAKRNDTKIDHKSCECIVAKNSHGETTSVMLEWQGEFMRFKSME